MSNATERQPAGTPPAPTTYQPQAPSTPAIPGNPTPIRIENFPEITPVRELVDGIAGRQGKLR